MKEWFQNKALPKITTFFNSKGINAIKNGMLYALPFIIVGSILLLLANLPIPAVSAWLADAGISPILMQGYNASMAMMAMFAVIGIGSSYAKEAGFEGLPAGLLSLSIYILLQADTVANSVTALGKTLSLKAAPMGVLDRGWFGPKGMIAAIIIGLVVSALYSWFLKKNIVIKLPDAVPSNVATSFTALIPATVIILGSIGLYAILSAFHTDFFTLIYTLIQTPLQGMTDSFGGAVLLAMLPPLLWFFGVHGTTIVTGIMTPILMANSAENMELFSSGKLTVAQGGHILTQAFQDNLLVMTGTGVTAGFVIFMLLGAKSVQLKEMGKLTGVPTLFNINEPVLFGAPVVLNPTLLPAFFLTPLMIAVLTYGAMATGLLPLFNGVVVPWTTPAIVSGFIIGGWQMALWQALMIAMAAVIWWIFGSRYDKQLLAQEQANA